MATIQKRKWSKSVSWVAQVRRKGFKSLVKTFKSRSSAVKWARHMEKNLDSGIVSDFSEASKLKIKDIINRYLNERKHTGKKGWRVEEYNLGKLMRDPVVDVNLLQFGSKDITDYKIRRLEEVCPTTFNKSLSLLKVLIDTAIHDWGINIPINPCINFKRLREPKPRDRRLEGDEESRLIKACARSDNKYLKPMVELSIETALRKGELLSLKFNQIDWSNRTITLTETKNYEKRVVPLSEKAYGILRSQVIRLDGRIFPMTVDSLKFWWKQAKRRAKIKDFRYHDLRRHSCSLLFEKGLSVPEVQLISGHKDPRVLLNTYTKLDPVKIAKKL